MPKQVIYTALTAIPHVSPGDDLAGLIVESLGADGVDLADGDILVIAQKIVSKAEARYLDLATVTPSARATKLAADTGKDARLVEAILSESSEVVRTGPSLLIVAHRLGYVMANAGIDESNVQDDAGTRRVLLLPHDPDASCDAIKARLDARFGVDIGVIVNDSFGRPWRNGVVGVALGAAGVPALRDMRGEPDLFGRPLRVTEIAVADELAAAASLIMGQASEGLPVVHVRGYERKGAPRPARSLVRAKERDLFR